MNRYVKYIVSAALFVGVFSLAVFSYNKLSGEYKPEEYSVVKESAAVTTENEKNKAKDFAVTDKDGKKVNLSDYFGKPIVINFWATWCGPCKSELPSFDKVYAENNDEIAFLMVNLTDGYQDTVSSVKTFVEQNGYTFPVFYDTDGAASNKYKVSGIPMTVFIDKNGVVKDTHVGMMSEEALREYLSSL